MEATCCRVEYSCICASPLPLSNSKSWISNTYFPDLTDFVLQSREPSLPTLQDGGYSAVAVCDRLKSFHQFAFHLLPSRCWYPPTRETFSSQFEEAAHHIHYNRLSELRLLVEIHPDIINQCSEVNHSFLIDFSF